MDDFLTESSFILGVSQVSLETEYYMVDLPKLIQKKFEKDNVEKLLQLQLMIASNQRTLEKAEYKELVESLTPKKVRQAPVKFDRDKFEQLRKMQG